MMPIALTEKSPLKSSSSAPAYSPSSVVEPKEAAALEAAGVERQADAVRRHERHVEIRRAEVSRLKTQRGAQPDVLDHGFHRAEVELQHRARVERDAFWPRARCARRSPVT